MIIFFDTETTGVADMKRAPDAPGQPRLVQLAALLTDETSEEVSHFSVIVRPEGFEIPEAASAIHGITTERAMACGVGIKVAIRLFRDIWDNAALAVAHNIDFDLFVMYGEFDLDMDINMVRTPWGKSNEIFCTMKAMTPICKLPGKYSDYKWPKLQEAYKHAFGSEFGGAHDALADVRACARIYFWLKNQSKTE